MIVSRSPFRLTLGGGGTDLPSFYERHGGLIFAMGIDKYMYVAINPPVVDRKIRVKYTKSETVKHPSDLQHELAREALKKHEIFSRMEVTSMADLPAGSGLGSSSCYLVGLLSALRTYRRDYCSQKDLAEEACDIELNVLKNPIGKQDQYMAAFGGLTILEIDKAGEVSLRTARQNNSSMPDFLANTHVYFTGVQRSAPEILSDQDNAMRSQGGPAFQLVQECLLGIKDVGYGIIEAFESENYDSIGKLMHDHWQFKKRMSPRITIPGIDALYGEVQKRFGVLGGKVSGAGGGGFFVVYAPDNHIELNKFMESNGLQRLSFGLEFEGCKVICNSAHSPSGLFTHEAASES